MVTHITRLVSVGLAQARPNKVNSQIRTPETCLVTLIGHCVRSNSIMVRHWLIYLEIVWWLIYPEIVWWLIYPEIVPCPGVRPLSRALQRGPVYAPPSYLRTLHCSLVTHACVSDLIIYFVHANYLTLIAAHYSKLMTDFIVLIKICYHFEVCVYIGCI